MGGSISSRDVPPDLIREFDYRPHRLKTLFLFLLATIGSCLLACLAVTWEGPVPILGFRLTQAQGRVLFGTIAALSPLGLVALGGLVYIAFAYNRRVAVTTTSLILPRPTRLGLSCDEIQIPLKSISRMRVRDFIGSTKMIRIQYDGNVVHIPGNMLRDKKTFEDLADMLHAAIVQAQAGEES